MGNLISKTLLFANQMAVYLVDTENKHQVHCSITDLMLIQTVILVPRRARVEKGRPNQTSLLPVN